MCLFFDSEKVYEFRGLDCCGLPRLTRVKPMRTRIIPRKQKTMEKASGVALFPLQNHITENYYTCNREILSGLGQMYVADERFKNNIDKHAEGTAEFISEAIAIYSQKQ